MERKGHIVARDALETFYSRCSPHKQADREQGQAQQEVNRHLEPQIEGGTTSGSCDCLFDV